MLSEESLSARLLDSSIGHMGKINDFIIKPVEQHSFLSLALAGIPHPGPLQCHDFATAADAGRGHGINGSALLGPGTPLIDGAPASRRSKPSRKSAGLGSGSSASCPSRSLEGLGFHPQD